MQANSNLLPLHAWLCEILSSRSSASRSRPVSTQAYAVLHIPVNDNVYVGVVMGVGDRCKGGNGHLQTASECVGERK
jgi:hypothetical protein